MKIGQVSTKYRLPVDTIYYYINYGLLVPPRKGGNYYFDEKTLIDLERILELKNLEFTLREIHQILSLYRISDLADRQDVEDLKVFFAKKMQQCIAQREYLAEVIDELNQKIIKLNQKFNTYDLQTGLPISMLNLVCCPNCGSDLNITDAEMNLRYIFRGVIRCTCGYQAKIENGIMLTPNKNTDIYDTPDIHRKVYKDLPPDLITLFQYAYNYMIKQLDKINLEGKVVLETYVNAWFFMHNHQQYLNPKGKYIVVDKYPETLLMYKKLIEKYNYGLDVLYIADSSTDFPLKPGCVNVNIDFFAINEHNFYHDTFLLDQIKDYFARDIKLLGTYFYFINGHRSKQQLLKEYPTCYKENFNLAYFNQSLKQSGFDILEHENCGYTTSSGNNIGFSFHMEGEKMCLNSYLAEKSSVNSV